MIFSGQLFCSHEGAGGENVSPDFSIAELNQPVKKINRLDKRKLISSEPSAEQSSPRLSVKSLPRYRNNSKNVVVRIENSPFQTGCWDYSEFD